MLLARMQFWEGKVFLFQSSSKDIWPLDCKLESIEQVVLTSKTWQNSLFSFRLHSRPTRDLELSWLYNTALYSREVIEYQVIDVHSDSAELLDVDSGTMSFSSAISGDVCIDTYVCHSGQRENPFRRDSFLHAWMILNNREDNLYTRLPLRIVDTREQLLHVFSLYFSPFIKHLEGLELQNRKSKLNKVAINFVNGQVHHERWSWFDVTIWKEIQK